MKICAEPQQDAVAAFDANSAQHVAEASRELAHFGVRVGPLADPCRDLTATAGRHVMIDRRFGDIEALRDAQVRPLCHIFRGHLPLSAKLPHLSRSLTSIGSLSNWRQRRQCGYSGAMGKMKKLFGIGGLIVFGFVLALIVADAGIRIANHWFPYFYCYDDYRDGASSRALRDSTAGRANPPSELTMTVFADPTTRRANQPTRFASRFLAIRMS